MDVTADYQTLTVTRPGDGESRFRASILSLELQGDPYSAEEVAEFDEPPCAADAVRLRRWDDVGKIAGLDTPGLEHYRPVLETELLGQGPRR